MADKRRFVSSTGAIFVPNVADDTIEQKVASGEWTPVVPKPEPVKKPAAKTAAPKK